MGWLWVLPLLLCAMQMLGQWHAVLHGPISAIGLTAGPEAHHHHRPHALSASADTAWAHEHDHGHGIGRLFGDHPHDADCRLYDQLCQADDMPAAAAHSLPVVPPTALQAWWSGEALLRWAALFDARGPPSFR